MFCSLQLCESLFDIIQVWNAALLIYSCFSSLISLKSEMGQ